MGIEKKENVCLSLSVVFIVLAILVMCVIGMFNIPMSAINVMLMIYFSVMSIGCVVSAGYYGMKVQDRLVCIKIKENLEEYFHG